MTPDARVCAQYHDHRRRLREIVEHFESDANLHSKGLLSLLTARSGYETSEYKAPAASFDQIRPAAEKTMANCRKSAHAATMSEKPNNFVRRFAGLPA